MNEKYDDCVEQISGILFKTLIEREKNLNENIREIDKDLLSLLHIIGLKVMSMLLSWLGNKVSEEVKKIGWKIQRKSKIKYTVIFGELTIQSPYLWNKNLKQGMSPVTQKLGISHGNQSLAVKRALTEFGSEESFEQAAKRFQEHYGFSVERNKVRREVETIAQKAEIYVSKRLKNAKKKSKKYNSKNPQRILLELDGCQLRTGLMIPSEKEELTPKRKLKKKSRKIDWKETRVGLAREVEKKENRTFVALMAKYPEIVEQLVGAAYEQGMSSQSQILAVADGGNGLKEALEKRFANLQFILDYAHFKKHIYEGIDAMELPKEAHGVTTRLKSRLGAGCGVWGVVKICSWTLDA